MAVSSLDTPSFALIDGKLCRLNRRGTVTKRHAPLGTAVAEFRVVGDRIYVREQADGFLLGMPNLYCLDLNLFITWLAELPAPDDAYDSIASAEADHLTCRSVAGLSCRVNTSDGKVIGPVLV